MIKKGEWMTGICSLGSWLDSDGCHQPTFGRQSRAGSMRYLGASWLSYWVAAGNLSWERWGEIRADDLHLEISEYGALQLMRCPVST